MAVKRQKIKPLITNDVVNAFVKKTRSLDKREFSLPDIKDLMVEKHEEKQDVVQSVMSKLNEEQRKIDVFLERAENNKHKELTIAWRTAQVVIINHYCSLKCLYMLVHLIEDPLVAQAKSVKEKIDSLTQKVDDLKDELSSYTRTHDH